MPTGPPDPSPPVEADFGPSPDAITAELLDLTWQFLTHAAPTVRAELGQFLTDHGYRTLEASTAGQGWELVRSRQPRLCLLDLNLPDGSGLDLLKKIIANGLNVRVIVMTAFDLKHLRPAHAEKVLAGWMTKPVDPEELLTLVEKTMDPT